MARDRAAEVIGAVLADGPRVAGDVERAAVAAGVSIRTVRRAAAAMGLVRIRDGARVVWTLPPDPAGAGPGGTAPVPATHPDPGDVPDDRQEIDTMTDTDARPLTLLALLDGLTVAGHVLRTGDVVTLDGPALDGTRDRHGASWADDLSPGAQMARWGQVHVAVINSDAVLEPVDTVPETVETPTVTGPSPRRVVAGPLPAVAAPGNHRMRPEGSVPLLAGLHGDGPVTVVPDVNRS